MKSYCQQNLEEIKKLVIQLTHQQYAFGPKLLSDTSLDNMFVIF